MKTSIKTNRYTIQFLKEELDKFKWPTNDDIQDVPGKYIFYGPIEFIWFSPFEIKRSEKLNIIKMYKQLK